MSWDVRVTPNARRDRDQALAWFDTNRPSVSENFIDDYRRTLHRIRAHADLPPVDDRGFRRIAFDTFKFHIWYRIIDGSNIVYVVLVNHQGRDPEMIDRRLSR